MVLAGVTRVISFSGLGAGLRLNWGEGVVGVDSSWITELSLLVVFWVLVPKEELLDVLDGSGVLDELDSGHSLYAAAP